MTLKWGIEKLYKKAGSCAYCRKDVFKDEAKYTQKNKKEIGVWHKKCWKKVKKKLNEQLSLFPKKEG